MLIILASFFVSNKIFAQQKKSRILFIVDASSSMTNKWNLNNTRFDVAGNILLKIVDSIYARNNEIEFGLRVYGSEFPAIQKVCYDTKLEVPFNLQNAYQIKNRLKYINNIGTSPIAYSLEQAASNEINNENDFDYSIIFITDGGETCDGDICKTYQELLSKKIKVKPYIIGLDKNELLLNYYNCMGKYIEVSNVEDIDKAVELILLDFKVIYEKPKTLNIETKYAKPEPIKEAPIVKKEPEKIKIEEPKPIEKPIEKPKPIEINKTSFSTIIEKSRIKIGYNTIIPIEILTKKNNFKAALHFNFEEEKAKIEEPVVIKKEINVIPKMPTKVVKLLPIIGLKKETVTAKKNVFKTNLNFVFEKEVVKENVVFKKLNSISAKTFLISKPTFVSASKKKNQFKSALRFTFEPEHENIVFRKLDVIPARHRYTYAYKINNLPPRKNNFAANITINLPKPEPKKIEVVDLTKPKPKPMPTSADDISYEIKTETSATTEVQIYFTDGKSKTYPNARPQIEVLNSGDKASIKKFVRNMNGNIPASEKINAGTYDFIVLGQRDLYVKNIAIEANKINKVYIKVTEGSLQFAYIGNAKRPVEFNAVVKRLFSQDPTVVQKCIEKNPYEPGNYNVRIETLPPSRFTTDITFNAITELQIPEPGYLQISNSTPRGKVVLQTVLGDQYVSFFDMNITGNVLNQKIEIQPGVYKIIYLADPNVAQLGSKEIEFRVKSNLTTTVELQ
ncbi:MAG: VWA domain-containing protein [Chitinophagaceae bacterium]|nr:VWA domain-containing protein [Chitinophagaceae bacterium]